MATKKKMKLKWWQGALVLGGGLGLAYLLWPKKEEEGGQTSQAPGSMITKPTAKKKTTTKTTETNGAARNDWQTQLGSIESSHDKALKRGEDAIIAGSDADRDEQVMVMGDLLDEIEKLYYNADQAGQVAVMEAARELSREITSDLKYLRDAQFDVIRATYIKLEEGAVLHGVDDQVYLPLADSPAFSLFQAGSPGYPYRAVYTGKPIPLEAGVNLPAGWGINLVGFDMAS